MAATHDMGSHDVGSNPAGHIRRYLTRRRWLGRLIAVASILAAVVIGIYTLQRLDQQPRTNDGYLFADMAGLAPDVSGRIVSLNIRDNQRVSKGDPLPKIGRSRPLPQAQARQQVTQSPADIAGTTGTMHSSTAAGHQENK
jgi:membrane fusion protein, multidrug efflux system